MKGLKKCSGLLLLLFTMLGLSLSVFSVDSSALKHEVSAIPLYDYYVTYDYDGDTYFWSGFADTFKITQSGLDFNRDNSQSPIAFSSKSILEGNTLVCTVGGYSENYSDGHWAYYSSNNALTPMYGVFNFWPNSYFYSADNISSVCNKLLPFGTSEQGAIRPPFVWDSLPSLVVDGKYRKLNPYSYNYASYFISQSAEIDGTFYQSHEGVQMNYVLGESNLFQITSPSSIFIPIGMIADIKSSDFVSIVEGTTLDFSFEMAFPGVYGYNLSELEEQMDIELNYVYLADNNPNSQPVTGQVSCPYTIEEIENYGLYYNWTCHFVSPANVYNGDVIEFLYTIEPSSGYNSIWDWTFNAGENNTLPRGNWAFPANGSINVVTDGYYTPGNSIGGSATGSDLSMAPGSVYHEYADGNAEADWFNSLLNLFNFNALNPFAPLFNMFTNNSQCASIPIIAGMLHAEETTYCPWFSASVRDVLTPVLSISAIMLIFGFFVRWLSSSSGNMFEDQTTHKWGNTQIGQQKHGKY